MDYRYTHLGAKHDAQVIHGGIIVLTGSGDLAPV